MSKVRFIHASDIHLGSFLHVIGEVPAELAGLSVEATYEAFENICDAAIEENVDFIVVSGDLYDREARSVKGADFFAKQCSLLLEHKIHVYIIAGNHDPIGEQPELFALPDNVTAIGCDDPEIHSAVNKKGEQIARVIGQSYRGREDARKMHLGYHAPDSSLPNIALLHTQLEAGNNRYVPCTLPELKENREIDYWALGHIHKRRILNDSKPVIAYSGIPQGRDINEEGIGGCFLVEMSSNEAPKLSLIPTSPVVWATFEISLDDGEEPRNINELIERMSVKAEEFLAQLTAEGKGENGKCVGVVPSDCKPGRDRYSINMHLKGCIVRWVLRGRIDMHDTLMQQGTEVVSLLEENLRQRFRNKSPFLWTDSVEINTTKKIDFEELKKSSRLYEEIDASFETFQNDEEFKRVLIPKLGQIIEFNADPEDFDEHRIQINDDTYAEILARARDIIFEKLYEGREPH